MRNIILSLVVLLSNLAWAHGEDKPGPHGGYISMPGAFHVELVPVDKNRIKVYFLDAQWKISGLAGSSVGLTYGKTSAKCTDEIINFLCEFPLSVDLTKPGQLVVNAVRGNQSGSPITYALPLRFKGHH